MPSAALIVVALVLLKSECRARFGGGIDMAMLVQQGSSCAVDSVRPDLQLSIHWSKACARHHQRHLQAAGRLLELALHCAAARRVWRGAQVQLRVQLLRVCRRVQLLHHPGQPPLFRLTSSERRRDSATKSRVPVLRTSSRAAKSH